MRRVWECVPESNSFGEKVIMVLSGSCLQDTKLQRVGLHVAIVNLSSLNWCIWEIAQVVDTLKEVTELSSRSSLTEWRQVRSMVELLVV